MALEIQLASNDTNKRKNKARFKKIYIPIFKNPVKRGQELVARLQSIEEGR